MQGRFLYIEKAMMIFFIIAHEMIKNLPVSGTPAFPH